MRRVLRWISHSRCMTWIAIPKLECNRRNFSVVVLDGYSFDGSVFSLFKSIFESMRSVTQPSPTRQRIQEHTHPQSPNSYHSFIRPPTPSRPPYPNEEGW